MKKEFLLLLFICPLVFLYVFSNQVKRHKTERKAYVTLEDSFEILQGIETDDWSYIQTKRDYQDLEKYSALYKKNYKHQFNCSPGFKVPKIIHVIWVGPRPFPSESIENIRTWMAHHPDWIFKFWTDRNRPAPCNGMELHLVKEGHFKFLLEKYQASKNWGEKADILRYEILYEQGGVYIDHDVACLRPFHRLNAGYDFYAGLEMPHEEIDKLALTAGNAILGAKPGHPILRGTIQSILNRWDEVTERFSGSDPLVQARCVTHRTLVALTYGIENHINQPGNTDVVFPACYFFPQGKLPGFYARHHCITTWNAISESPNERFFREMLLHLRDRDAKIIRVELMSLVAMIVCFIIYFLINKEVKRKCKRES